VRRSPNDVRDRVVIVTGASRGIGSEVCARFAERGARIGLIARSATALESAAAMLDARFAASTCVAPADVADPDALASAVDRIVRALGPADILVNNAGHGDWGPVVDTDMAVFRRSLDVNVLGAVHATALVLPGMVQRGWGRIVNIGSIAGRIGVPYEAPYSAGKFALVGYTEALAGELAGSGVHVSLIEPGPVATSFADRRDLRVGQPRPIEPGVVADAVLAAVLRRRAEQFRPRWLRAAHLARVAFPPLHRAGVRWMYRGERRR
jgi:short-subunit dehydrogenase